MDAQKSENPQWDLAEFDIRERWRTRPPEEFPSKWACEWGFDEYGLWQTFEIAGGKQKMRYIPPGSFLMGSLEDEPAIEGIEQRHKVTLTEGYWLGETTVSQALWQVIMNNNPSHFKPEGDEVLPVDSVSWDDCTVFCQKLSDITQVNFQLPSEAQWEYAYRAGTLTPFNTGEQLTTSQANYYGDYPYQGRQSLSDEEMASQVDRNKTVDVNHFQPNAWGLKQMHGNVWEWCLDDRRDFTPNAETIPVGELDTRGAAPATGNGLSRQLPPELPIDKFSYIWPQLYTFIPGIPVSPLAIITAFIHLTRIGYDAQTTKNIGS